MQNIIEEYWNQIQNPSVLIANNAAIEAAKILKMLNNGDIKISEKINNQWHTNEWIRKAILIYFKTTSCKLMNGNYYDKIPLKFSSWDELDFSKARIRVVPGTIARYGSYFSSGCVLMPSFINVGVYVGANTMIDINSTLGSCCYIGDNCHVGAGSVIGGVLEPLSEIPVIIEDKVFIGACCSITSGVRVSNGAVIAPGTHISQSTRIYDSVHNQISYGVIPENAVVISGTIPRDNTTIFPQMSCAIIVKYVNEATRNKIAINDLLR